MFLNQAISKNKKVLAEGAQGTHLDVDHGTYPFVTSSSPTAGGACTGLGIGPNTITEVMGIVKAYTTRVGSGPFPTEQENELGELLRARGREYGATTGRARRCGWADTLIIRHAVRVNGMTSAAITKLDVLDTLEELKICVGYRYKGKLYEEMPSELAVLEKGDAAVYHHAGVEADHHRHQRNTKICRRRPVPTWRSSASSAGSSRPSFRPARGGMRRSSSNRPFKKKAKK